jgi:hypothetical protein
MDLKKIRGDIKLANKEKGDKKFGKYCDICYPSYKYLSTIILKECLEFVCV